MKIQNLIHLLRIFFPKTPVHSEKCKREIEENLVSRYALGSISLHIGRYVTAEDARKLKEKVSSYSFVK